MTDETIRDVLTRALDAYAALELLGEEIEDEWTYVTDLEAAWRDHLTDIAERRATSRSHRPSRRRSTGRSTRSGGSRTRTAPSTGSPRSRRSCSSRSGQPL